MSSTSFVVSPLLVAAVACGSSASQGSAPSDAGLVDLGAVPPDGADMDAGQAQRPPLVDGGYVTPDGALLPANRFITTLVSFDAGTCAGFGKSRMPDVIFGPPAGAGDAEGGLDVVSLGVGGEIVVSFAPNAIIDGPGVDLLVFENAFFPGGNPSNSVFADPAEVSVSDDLVTWKTFRCTATATPWGACAGWHPVYSNPQNGISPFDPAVAGGDPFDLADVGLARAQYVRIRDKSTQLCSPNLPKPNTDGFDLDAMAIVNAVLP